MYIVMGHIYCTYSFAPSSRRSACTLQHLALGVNVAEGPIHRAHGISLSDVGERSLEHGSQGHGIIECTVATGRVVEEGESVCKSELAVLDILVLPDPPDAIDLGVMNCISVRDYLLVAVM